MTNPFPSDRTVTGSLCYLIHAGRVLLLKRNRPPHVGLWSPPGGKMEFGESPQENIRREMLEETGLTIAQPTLRAIISVLDVDWPVHWLLFVFRAELAPASGDMITTPEGELRWIALAELDSFPRPETDRRHWPAVLGDGALCQAKFVYDTPQHLVSHEMYGQ